MQPIFKRKLKDTSSEYSFIDNIKQGLRRNWINEKLDYVPVLKYEIFKHHSEIYDMCFTDEKTGESQSILKLFKQFYLIVMRNDNQIKIYISPKIKTSDSHNSNGGYNQIDGYLNELKSFLRDKIDFVNSSVNEIIFYD